MSLDPIYLFMYNRLQVIKQTVEAFQKNYIEKESELFIHHYNLAINHALLKVIHFFYITRISYSSYFK